MAYYKPDDEDEQQQMAAGGGLLGSSGQAGGGMVGAPAAPAAGHGSGSSFPGIQAFLQGNRAQGQQMARGLSDRLASAGQAAKGQADSVYGTFHRGVQGQLQGQPTSYIPGRTENLEKVAAYHYGGPNQLSETQGYDAAGKNLAGAASDWGQAGTLGGLQSLLGGNRFDAALVKNANAPGLSDWRSQYSNLSSYLGNMAPGAEKEASEAKSTIEGRAKDAQSTLEMRKRSAEESAKRRAQEEADAAAEQARIDGLRQSAARVGMWNWRPG